MELYLGVDGGQTATKALVGDARGRVLGRGRSGPCNHVGAAEGRAKLERALTAAVGEALREAGAPAETRFEAACFGMSGGPDDKRAIIEALIPAGIVDVVTDAHIALEGALGGEPGVVVIAGTGSMALGRGSDGRTLRAGGWGYQFGDEGGGFDIVRQALRAALRMEEGWGRETSLRGRLLEETGAADINRLMHEFYTTDWPRSRVAGLAPLVAKAAEEGDEEGDGVAADILREAGRVLAGYANAVGGRLPDASRVSYVGGVFGNEVVLRAFCDAVRGTVNPPRFDPAGGALLAAYRLAGKRVDLQV